MIATRGFVRTARSSHARLSLFPIDAEALRVGHPRIRLVLIGVVVCRGYQISCLDCSTLAIPGGHEQNFLAGGIPEYVVDIDRAIDLEESGAARVRPVRKTGVEQKAQLSKLLRRVFPEIFNHSR